MDRTSGSVRCAITMSANTMRPDRASATREAILTAAERLFAEHGVFAISNRQVSEAAGQGNNTAVGYHFGTKADLVRAIVRKHTALVEEQRARLLAEYEGSTDVRDWISCLVRPATDHLGALEQPTYYARFCAQVITDPTLRPIIYEEALSSPALLRIRDSLNACLPELPADVHTQRAEMARLLMTHVPAEYERALAAGMTGSHASWQDCGTGLIDAIVGIWQAPVTR